MHTRCLALALLSLSSTALWASQNEKTAFSIGPTASWLESDAGDADLTGLSGTVQIHLAEFVLCDLALRGGYAYQTSSDDTDFTRQDADLDLVASATVLGILTPFASVGAHAHEFDAVGYSGESDWDAGYALGAGVEIMILPGLLSTTPSVRYADTEHLDTLTYALDLQLHFSVVAVGVTVTYEDNLSRDGEVTGAGAYAALRF